MQVMSIHASKPARKLHETRTVLLTLGDPPDCLLFPHWVGCLLSEILRSVCVYDVQMVR
jgi:hypothetical protein